MKILHHLILIFFTCISLNIFLIKKIFFCAVRYFAQYLVIRLSIDNLSYNNLAIIYIKRFSRFVILIAIALILNFVGFIQRTTHVIFFEIKSSTGNCSQKLYINPSALIVDWRDLDMDRDPRLRILFWCVSDFSRSKFLPVVASHIQNAVIRHVSLLRKHVGRNRLKRVNARSCNRNSETGTRWKRRGMFQNMSASISALAIDPTVLVDSFPADDISLLIVRSVLEHVVYYINFIFK